MRSGNVIRGLGIGSVLLMGSIRSANADDPPAPAPAPAAANPEIKTRLKTEPLPLAPIPDDPPPHEGTMISLPYTISPPDLIRVEVLEALPGRPITGERLVRPDGFVSLEFYGDVYVRGLTVAQAKTKIVLHLRKFLRDDVLGLLEVNGEEPAMEPPAVPPPEGGDPFAPTPFDIKKPAPDGQGAIRKSTRLTSAQPPSNRLATGATSKAPRVVRKTALQEPAAPLVEPQGTKVQVPAGGGIKITIEVQGQEKPPEPPKVEVTPEQTMSPEEMKKRLQELKDKNKAMREQDMPPDADFPLKGKPIDPADTDKVFVDVTGYNSTFYYVQGDVAAPGRMPVTGQETVLDALNYGGGLISTADAKNIKLVRPARGGKPARTYKVDLEAILETGDQNGNYQLFPGDRLVVGRLPLVKSTILLERSKALQDDVLSSMNTISSMTRNFVLATHDMKPADREALMKNWMDLWWKRAGGSPSDQKAMEELILRQLKSTPSGGK